MLKIFLVFILCTPFVFAQTDLQYRDRGDRYEGIHKLEKISGGTIELLSALAYSGIIRTIPNTLKLRFFLEEDSNKVDLKILSIRESDERYRMDLKRKPWKSGFNDYEWSTQIIKKLNPQMFRPESLGIVVRIDSDYSSIKETISPVIFYNDNSSLPIVAEGYKFVIKTENKAKLSWSIHKAQSSKNINETPIYAPENQIRLDGFNPKLLLWTPKQNVVEGGYALYIQGRELNGTEELSKIVYFYHKPEVIKTKLPPIPVSKKTDIVNKLCTLDLNQVNIGQADLLEELKCQWKVIRELQKK